MVNFNTSVDCYIFSLKGKMTWIEFLIYSINSYLNSLYLLCCNFGFKQTTDKQEKYKTMMYKIFFVTIKTN